MNPMFYFLLALTAVLAATANAGGPVFDVDGDIITGGSYYVLPRIGAAGGGLTLASRGADQCPLYIGQESSEVERGIPVKFSNWKSRVGFVPESENLNIEMDVAATICVQSTYWWLNVSVGDTRTDTRTWSLTWLITAGPKPKSEMKDSMSFFQIKRTGDFVNGYKIGFCPTKDCSTVGIFEDENGVRRLALGYTPFEVVFVKATETETSPKTMSII